LSKIILSNVLGRFRFIAVLEGISFIVLLFIAMPLKYLAGLPLAVKYVGWSHGVLFVFYMLLLLQVWFTYKWKFGKVIWAVFASLLPFGTFVLDWQLRNEQTSVSNT
jgi:integral membrane protein